MMPIVYNRDLAIPTPVILSGVELFVNRYSFHYHKGPESASISARGTQEALFGMLGYLRCPILILNSIGQEVWWGYISGIEVRWGSRVINTTIARLANKVCVMYTVKVPNSADEKKVTSWTEDVGSQAVYGVRERIIGGGDRTDAEATALRDYTLAIRRYPRQNLSTGQSQGQSASCLITCMGWWDTLKWKYYMNTSDNSVDTGTLVGNIIDDVGQFIARKDIITSGVNGTSARDGTQTSWSYIEDLLALGTSDGRPLCTSISKDRTFSMWYSSASSTPTYYIDDKDRWMLYPTGTEVRKDTCPVGGWYRVLAVPPIPNVEGLFPPSDNFIARSNYEVSSGELTIEPLGVTNPMEALSANTEEEAL